MMNSSPDGQTSVCLFIQKRATRAGAQVSLSRIVTSPEIRALTPFVLLGGDGWLDSFLTEQSVPHVIETWPSPRSLGARLGGLNKFAREIIQQLADQGITPFAIVANDHGECLLAQALARAAGGCRTAVILRSSNMTEDHFRKYRCAGCDVIFARGDTLTNHAKQWSQRDVTRMLGSFTDDDFFQPQPSSPTFPEKILVVGSAIPAKGFNDVLDAIQIIEQNEPDFPAIEYVFTGDKSDELAQLAERDYRSQFTFVGRVENFSTFARQFGLAIHPSRLESFGMAPLELLLAGVPTMVSSTGVIDALPLSHPWVFPPQSPESLAAHLIELWKSWPCNLPDIPQIQQFVRENYHLSRSTQPLAKALTD